MDAFLEAITGEDREEKVEEKGGMKVDDGKVVRLDLRLTPRQTRHRRRVVRIQPATTYLQHDVDYKVKTRLMIMITCQHVNDNSCDDDTGSDVLCQLLANFQVSEDPSGLLSVSRRGKQGVWGLFFRRRVDEAKTFVLRVEGRRKKGPQASQEDNLTLFMHINVETT